MTRLTAVFAVLALLTVPAAGERKRSVLAVFAHPDDEFTVAPLMVRYAAEGHSVHLVTVTSGQLGVTDHAGIPAGEQLARVREEETRCSASKLGINPPLLLQYQDQGISAGAVMDEIAARLRQIIAETRPDAVITCGPDGLTGHPDHRATSNITTQVFQQRDLLQHRAARLYYVAYPEARLRETATPFGAPGRFRLVSEEFITTEVDGTGYMDKAYEALQCHKSQWTPEFMKGLHEIATQVLEGRVYLRQALPAPAPGERQTSIFADLP